MRAVRRQIDSGKPENNSSLAIQGTPLDTYRKKRKGGQDLDLKIVNPGYRNDKARRLNCQRCVPAYELRKRGFDVIAKPAVLDSNGIPVYDETMKNALNAFAGLNERLKSAGSFDGKAFIENRMLEFGDGARAQVFVIWKDSRSEFVEGGKVIKIPSAHTFVAENNNGKVRFIDPQSGNEDCSEYFTKIKNGYTMYAKIDDFPINEDIIDLYIANRGG